MSLSSAIGTSCMRKKKQILLGIDMIYAEHRSLTMLDQKDYER